MLSAVAYGVIDGPITLPVELFTLIETLIDDGQSASRRAMVCSDVFSGTACQKLQHVADFTSQCAKTLPPQSTVAAAV